jgi:fumarate reductase flavoprotein subunit
LTRIHKKGIIVTVITGKGKQMKNSIVVLVIFPVFLAMAGCAGTAPAAENTAAAPETSVTAETTASAAQNGIVIEQNPGPGPYTGRAGGYYGAVKVTLDVKDRVLVSVTAVGPEETVGIGSIAIDTMPVAMLEDNTIVVDTITGATFTSQGILEAAAKALAKAGLTDADLNR